MIASLRGQLLDRGPEEVIVEAGGVGYAVTVTAAALRGLPPVGAEARLFIYTHAVQDGGMHLFGFADAQERRLFETLLSVQGVGPKVAVAILSGLPTAELVRAIAAGDVARLTQVRGVGRKIAERLAVELRDRIYAVAAEGGAGGAGAGREGAGAAGSATGVPGGRLGEVHGALVALGYRPAEFEALLATLDAEQPAADLVKQALAGLRRK